MFKDVLSTAQKADNIELIKQLLELQKELQAMQQSNFELTKENAKLKEELELKRQMKYDGEHNYYFAITDPSTKDGPFCPKCWEKDHKQARLSKFRYDLKCNVCGLVVGDKNTRLDFENLKNSGINL